MMHVIIDISTRYANWTWHFVSQKKNFFFCCWKELRSRNRYRYRYTSVRLEIEHSHGLFLKKNKWDGKTNSIYCWHWLGYVFFYLMCPFQVLSFNTLIPIEMLKIYFPATCNSTYKYLMLWCCKNWREEQIYWLLSSSGDVMFLTLFQVWVD